MDKAGMLAGAEIAAVVATVGVATEEAVAALAVVVAVITAADAGTAEEAATGSWEAAWLNTVEA